MSKYYNIKELLEDCEKRDLVKGTPYVAILSYEEWCDDMESYDFGIDLDLSIIDIHNTKAEVNYDSLTGNFLVPDRERLGEEECKFAFALDEKGIVFIDESGKALSIIEEIKRTKKWKSPSLERFLYDFLEGIIKGDLVVIEKYERELSVMEDIIEAGNTDISLDRVNEIRGEIRELSVHYEQLIDLTQELEENENNFFDEKNVRYFRNYLNRLARHNDMINALKDYIVQVKDLYHTQLDVKQNRIMTLLTVVTTIFMPLTLITGWYGMNFKYMPELEMRYSYLVVIAASLVIAIGSLIFFKKKKWL